MFKKLQKKFAETTSDLSYKLEQLKYATQLPALSETDRQIVDEINHEGVAIRSIDQLSFPSTAALRESFKCLIADLKDKPLAKPEELEYKMGFDHCVPANPSRIAKAYPDLYLWGLDDRVLDIIENCIGMPVAYHGVIARKEINDGRQLGSRRWHKDAEDRNIIRISIYLNDVGEEDGPFEYVPRYVKLPHAAKSLDMPSDEDMASIVPASEWKACTGTAGTVVFAATGKIFHHGKVPTSKQERIAISYYYTSRQPTGAELCRTFSFQTGIPFITQPLSQRQREALWEYQALLPNNPQDTELERILEPVIEPVSEPSLVPVFQSAPAS
jgi:hypothetical protein